jgi:hypothetical protein
MLSAAVVLAALAVVALCDIPADEITSLPGWEGPLPSKQYSGERIVVIAVRLMRLLGSLLVCAHLPFALVMCIDARGCRYAHAVRVFVTDIACGYLSTFCRIPPSSRWLSALLVHPV